MPAAERADIESIYKNILLKYQWPMITMYFDEMSKQEQVQYLDYLNRPAGVSAYINNKISQDFGNKYKAIFVPSTYIELATLIVFAQQTFDAPPLVKNPHEDGWQRTVFPKNDLRNSIFTV